jgi:hypothetical protein
MIPAHTTISFSIDGPASNAIQIFDRFFREYQEEIKDVSFFICPDKEWPKLGMMETAKREPKVCRSWQDWKSFVETEGEICYE